jgi:hypothetical protein
MPKSADDAPAPAVEPNASLDLVRAIAGAIQQDVMFRPTRISGTPPPGIEGYDTTGWGRFKALKNALPVYTDVVSRDGKHYYHPRFKAGEDVLVPLNELTSKYVEMNYLERPSSWPRGQLVQPKG